MESKERNGPSTGRSLFPLLVFLLLESWAGLHGVSGQPTDANTCTNNTAAISAFIEKTRSEVALIAQRAQENEYNQCRLWASCNTNLSFYRCSNNTALNLTCLDTIRLLTPVSVCGNLTCTNQLFGFAGPSIRFPPNVYLEPKTGHTTQKNFAYEQSVCKQRFTDLFQKLVPSSTINASFPFANWRYYGDILGVTSSFPFQSGQQTQDAIEGTVTCTPEYDNRRRPWYVGAISAHKSLVVVVDVGPSMDGSINYAIGDLTPKIAVAQYVASTLMYTLKVGDAMAVVTFGSPSDVVTLQTSSPPVTPIVPLGIRSPDPADRPEVRVLNNSIYNISVRSGGDSTGLQAAISQAIYLLGLPTAQRVCQKQIIILSDGQNLGAVGNATAISATIAAGVAAQGQPITPFFFSVGAGDNDGDNLMKSTACSVNGTWARISSTENPLYNMRPYFNFLARTSPVYNGSYYSGVYDDASGLGRVFTISQPVFSNITGDLIGVAAGDTSILATKQFCSEAVTPYLTELASAQENCTDKSVFTPCLLPAVRGANNGYCPTPPGCKVVEAPTCSGVSVPKSAMFPPGITTGPLSSTRCCNSCAVAGGPNDRFSP